MSDGGNFAEEAKTDVYKLKEAEHGIKPKQN